MNLIALSINRPVFAWILMSALIIFGAICFNRLGLSQLPDVDFPVLSVSVNYEGASPEVIEAEVIQPIEQSLLAIEGIQNMRSTVRQGTGSIKLDFDINQNIDIAMQEVQAALSEIRLPTNIDPPVVRKRNPEESPIMFIGVSTERPLLETLNWVDNYLLDQFRFLPGVGEVNIAGFSERNLRIWPNMKKLRQLDLTVTDLLDAIQSQHLETAAGQFSNAEQEIRVRWLGEAATSEEVGEIKILRRGGATIQDRVYKVKEVALVEDGLSDIRQMARINGKPGISLSLFKQRGGNEVALAEEIRKKVADLQEKLPKGYELIINMDYTGPTSAVVNTTLSKLMMAAIVTIIICFLFLGSLQGALNILFSIPTSIVGTFIIIYFSGFTLNLFTLLALTLAISIVVDDAIMLLENIVRHSRMGKSPAQAAYDGSLEILPAATAASLAVVAVFLPVIFMSGITGKFFFQFGVTMSAAVLLSLLEAVTVTPMRSAAFLATSPKISRFEHWLDEVFERIAAAYRRSLSATLRFSKTVLFISFVVFLLSLTFIDKLKQEFVPQQDQNIVILNAQTPTGTSLDVTSQKALEIEKVLSKVPYIESFFISIGGGGGGGGGGRSGGGQVNQISVPIRLTAREKRSVTHVEIMKLIRKALKDVKNVRITMQDISSRGLTTGKQNPVAFNLSGPDLKVLQIKSQEIANKLNKEGLTQDMDTDFKSGLPELLIRPDRMAMAERGVSIESVARTLSATVAGIRQNQLTADGRRYDMRIKLHDYEVHSIDDIKGIEVRNNYGFRVPLSQLVKFEKTDTYQSISRINRQRSIGSFGNLAPGKSQGKVLERAEQIAHETLPEGYRFSLDGAASGLQESFKSLITALLLGILVAYMVLAIQFNSFIHPISVLVALPFSLSGSLFVLWIFGVSLNIFSFIGLIVLMGIAKKNSILLVEFTNHLRTEGQSDVRQALLEASPIRLRPILMTTIATIAAAVPLVYGNSIGQETRTPMGLTIIGGSAISTAFTLYVVPCLYLMLARFESKNKITLK